jgi:hypothetical protein
MISVHPETVRRIALACVHLIGGKGVINFPTSDRAHPSRWVVVGLGISGPLDEKYLRYFPMRIPWDLWQTLVVPLLEDADIKAATKTRLAELQIDWSALLGQWYSYLLVNLDPSLQALVEAGTVEDQVDGYPAVDPNLAWIEYPVIE